jgi:hypothetical protein
MHLSRKAADFEAFENDVIEALRRDPIRIPSSCVLSNHWHVVVWPETDGQVTKKRKEEERACNAGQCPRMGAGRRDTLETLLSDFVPPFPASGRRNVRTLPRKVSGRQTELWDDARRSGRLSI